MLQGNCTASMPSLAALSLSTAGPGLLPQKPSQCLLSGFSANAMYVGGIQGFSIWVDNLYVREGDSTVSKLFIVTFSTNGPTETIWSSPSVWLTDFTLQGNGRSTHQVSGIAFFGPTYIESVLLADTRAPENGLPRSVLLHGTHELL